MERQLNKSQHQPAPILGYPPIVWTHLKRENAQGGVLDRSSAAHTLPFKRKKPHRRHDEARSQTKGGVPILLGGWVKRIDSVRISFQEETGFISTKCLTEVTPLVVRQISSTLFNSA